MSDSHKDIDYKLRKHYIENSYNEEYEYEEEQEYSDEFWTWASISKDVVHNMVQISPRAFILLHCLETGTYPKDDL